MALFAKATVTLPANFAFFEAQVEITLKVMERVWSPVIDVSVKKSYRILTEPCGSVGL